MKKNHLTAFDVKSIKGLYLGYSAFRKAYIIFDKRTLNVEESLHIVFDETVLTDKPNDLVELKNPLTDISLED